MTSRSFIFGTLLTFMPISAFAATFTAAIDRAHIGERESVTLQLTLSGAKARSLPDIDTLKQLFTIVSQAQSSNVPALSGAAGSSVGWRLTLIPRRPGLLTIPPLAIATDAGTLSTAPVKLVVDRGPTTKSSQISTGGNVVTITAKPSTTTPYQNQPIQYTVTCVVRGNISNISFNDFSVSSAIVERQGEPDIYDRVENGVSVRVAEFHYIITPLQSGKITIPPVVLQGKVQTPDIAALVDPLGKGFTFSFGMQQVMSFLSESGGEPFSAASNETVLDVKQPAVAMDPWLPVSSLKIKEDTDLSQLVEVGVPLKRKLALLAVGATGDQLPSLEAQQDRTNFKVYADKPTWGEDFDRKGGAIAGWRKESYSLIPQKAGRLALSAIRVSWWDIGNNKVATAELPERIINVRSTGVTQGLPIVGRSSSVRSSPVKMVPRPGFSFLYGGASVLAAVLLSGALWGLSLRHKISQRGLEGLAAGGLANRGSKKSAATPVAEDALKHVRSAEELKNFLQAYAQQHLGISKNTPLETIFLALQNRRTAEEREDLDVVIRALTAALYAGKTIDLEDIRKRCWRVIAPLRRPANDNQNARKKLPSLNPT